MTPKQIEKRAIKMKKRRVIFIPKFDSLVLGLPSMVDDTPENRKLLGIRPRMDIVPWSNGKYRIDVWRTTSPEGRKLKQRGYRKVERGGSWLKYVDDWQGESSWAESLGWEIENIALWPVEQVHTMTETITVQS